MAVAVLLSTLVVSGCGYEPSPAPERGLVLSDNDARYLAGIALEAWALGRSATGYQVGRCARVDHATAQCVTSIRFADNPSNPQLCSLTIAVQAAAPTVGVKQPTPADPTVDVEIEQYELPSGAYGSYQYGDDRSCADAQHMSGF